MTPAINDSRRADQGFRSGSGRDELRSFVRFPVDASATVWRDCSRVCGQVVNVSLGGAFIKLPSALVLHESVTVTIHDSTEPLELKNDLPATVVRLEADGCGVRFDRILLEHGVADSLYGPVFGTR